MWSRKREAGRSNDQEIRPTKLFHQGWARETVGLDSRHGFMWENGGNLYQSDLPAVLRIRIRDPLPFWPQYSWSGKGFFRILGIRTQTHIFESLMTIFWVKSTEFFVKWLNFFSVPVHKSNYFQLWDIYGYKKGRTKNLGFSSTLDPGSGMDRNQDLR
jgi:hypothetical protein